MKSNLAKGYAHTPYSQPKKRSAKNFFYFLIFLFAFSSCKKDFTAIEATSIEDNADGSFDKLNGNGSRPNIILIIAD
ncbi:MAG: hypothetical protein WAU24_10685, partial [Chitinophagaceae bacterium]